MRSYELVFVLKPDVTEAESKKLIDSVKTWIGKAEFNLKELGRKTLAYQIKKEREGIYFLLDITFEDDGVIPGGLDKKLLEQNLILRHLLIRKEGVSKKLKVESGELKVRKREAKKEVKRGRKSGDKKS